VADLGAAGADPGPAAADLGAAGADPGPAAVDQGAAGADPGPVTADQGAAGAEPGTVTADQGAAGDSLASIGVIGGTGLYEFLDDADEVTVSTPYGPPSDPLVIGEVAGRRVAFVPRHGRDHRFLPHRIPYRANLWALRSVGVRQVLAPSAVGSLSPSYGPGTLAVPDQLVDRTTGRIQTYYDNGPPVHVQFADPYCPVGRRCAVAAAQAFGWEPVPSGTLVVIEGPRFSTRAESRWYAAQGWTLIGMTGHPEAVLARELALCYTTITLVTDTDAGVEEGEGVTQAEVFGVFRDNTKRLRELLVNVIATLPASRDCPCPHALDGLDLSLQLP
jgi:5'-methylthioadenosine phosphorylase